MKGLRLLLAAAAAFAGAGTAAAAVTSASAEGFELRSRLVVPGTPDATWELLVHPALWWDPQHSWSLDAANLTIEPRAGGCFCEAVPPGGSAAHGRVLAAFPARRLVLDAPLGPLQSMAVSARLTWELRAVAGGTEVTQTYAVGGYVAGGADKLAGAVDEVISAQLERLKARAAEAK